MERNEVAEIEAQDDRLAPNKPIGAVAMKVAGTACSVGLPKSDFRGHPTAVPPSPPIQEQVYTD